MSKGRAPRDWGSLAGNGGVIALLLLAAGLLLGWQPRPITWPDPGPQRWLGAVGVIVAFAAFCFFIYWRRRAATRSAVVAGVAISDATLVVYASQTGMAEDLARRSAQALAEAGRAVRLLPVSALDADLLRAAACALFVVSTYGEGDPPDMAAGFARRVLASRLDLQHLRYGVLALGDSEYVNFCGFGRSLDAWLRQQGAQALFDRIDVDNGDPGTLRHWQHQLGVLAGRTDQPDWSPPRYARWRLQERELLNPGSAGGACFRLALQPAEGDAVWQAGDVAEIGPRHGAAQVTALLQQLQLDGAQLLDGGETLADCLARHQWPDIAQVRGQPPAQWLPALKPLPHREYSIASIAADGKLELLVRQWRQTDGSLGLGSGWLTALAAEGDSIALRLRTNSHFHMPADDCPLLLIGNGTGLAGLRALLKARVATGRRRNWLLFGERNRARDFFFRAEIEAWQQSGWLARVDLAFSRDQAERIYVQQRVAEAAAELRDWVAAGACIYVCGSLQGMAPAVDAQLRAALGADVLEQLAAQGRYRRDVY
jgi:sulfite reductase (NADPH) flavoprotein alpha-component